MDAATLTELDEQQRSGAAARVVNTELVVLYWRIGTLIRYRRAEQGWGTKGVDRLTADLRAAFPGMRGFSPRNLVHIQTFAGAVDGVVAQLPWGHITVLLDELHDPGAREFAAASHGVPRANTCSTSISASGSHTHSRSASKRGAHRGGDSLRVLWDEVDDQQALWRQRVVVVPSPGEGDRNYPLILRPLDYPTLWGAENVFGLSG